METCRVVAGAVVSLAVSLVGVALATNFRGVTEWHMRRSMATVGPLRGVPPWCWLPEAPYDRRLARFILLERVIGVAFAAVGVVFLAVLGYSILTDQPLQSVK